MPTDPDLLDKIAALEAENERLKVLAGINGDVVHMAEQAREERDHWKKFHDEMQASLRVADEASERFKDFHERMVADLIAERDQAERQRNNLLARIHRDGGHRHAEVGTEKACEEADLIVANLNASRDVLIEALTYYANHANWQEHLMDGNDYYAHWWDIEGNWETAEKALEAIGDEL
jgi:hypothetical protein